MDEFFTATGIRSVSPESQEFLFTEAPDAEQKDWAIKKGKEAAEFAGVDLATHQPPTDKPADFVTRALKLFPAATRPDHSKDIWSDCLAEGDRIDTNVKALIADDVQTTVEELFESLEENYDGIWDQLSEGWNLISIDGDVQSVTEPSEYGGAIFDSETFVNDPQFPNEAVFGQLLTDRGELYLWISSELLNGSDYFAERKLIDLGEGHTLLAHNAGFDYSRSAEAAELAYRNDWLDTISMAVSCDANNVYKNPHIKIRKEAAGIHNQIDGFSLASCYGFYVGGEISKDQRDVFSKALTLSDIRSGIAETIRYSLLDVLYTYRLVCALYPIYRERTPSVISLIGLSHIQQQALLVRPDFNDWVEGARQNGANIEKAQSAIWLQVIRNAAEHGVMAQTQHLDWAPYVHKRGRGKKAKERLTSLPSWYAKELQARHKARKKGEAYKCPQKVGPACLGLFWKDEPIVLIDAVKNPKAGRSKKEPAVHKNGYMRASDGTFPTPPNEDGASIHPTNPITYKREAQLSRNGGPLHAWQNSALEALIDLDEMGASISTITGRAWADLRHFSYEDGEIIPLGIRPNGTVTRRTSKAVTLTMKGSAKPNQPWSEQKARMECPSSHTLLYSDFSSQESVLMSLLAEAYVGGDFHPGFIGISATAMTAFCGDKQFGTDVHSKFAASMGLTRSQGKPASLASQYGQKAKNLGRKLFKDLPGVFKTQKMAVETAQKALDQRVGHQDEETGLYSGGTESDAHNRVTQLIDQADNPYEPFLGCRLQRNVSAKWKHWAACREANSLRNFPLQAGGSSMLSMCCAVYDNLVRRMGWTSDDARIIASVHDELVAVARREVAVEAAIILQLTHAIVWAKAFESCGLRELPLNRSLFDSINIDVRWRKSAKSPECSPSTPDGFPAGLELGSTALFEALDDPTFALPEPVSVPWVIPALDYEIEKPEANVTLSTSADVQKLRYLETPEDRFAAALDIYDSDASSRFGLGKTIRRIRGGR